MVINKILERQEIIERGGSITTEMIRSDETGDLDRLKRKYLDEMEKLGMLIVTTEGL